MNEEKTLRDEIAISLDANFIPTLDGNDVVKAIANKIGVDVDTENIDSMFDFAIRYQAWFRYKYANAMIKERTSHCT